MKEFFDGWWALDIQHNIAPTWIHGLIYTSIFIGGMIVGAGFFALGIMIGII